MRFLRTNTAVILTVGPFYDRTDGVTIETALTITNERITLTADTDDGSAPTLILDNITGATTATANDLNYITNNDAGLMQLELAAADVNRLGRMFLSITDAANHVPVFHELMVVTTPLFDAFFATSGGAIPNVTAGGSGGLLISGSNSGTTTLGALTVTGAITGNLTGNVTGSVGSVTGLTASNLDTTVSSRATPAQVNTEVLDVLNVDTFAEPGQEAPVAANTLVKKIGYLFKFLRNRKTQTATTLSVFADDATTVDQKATISDNGTTYDHGEIGTGP